MLEDIRSFAPAIGLHPLVMEICGTSYCNGSYLIHRSCSSVWVMEYIANGTGTVMLDGISYTASSGDVYLLPANHTHHYFSDSDYPWTKLFFNASGTLMHSLAENYGLTGQVVFKNCPVESLFRELISLTENRLSAEDLLSQCTLQVHRIFMALFNHNRKQINVPIEALQIKEYIGSRITGQVTMKELARLIYRSEDYVIQLFKSTFGQTPYAYFLEHKMELAKTLLASTKMSVGQVSVFLGFEDPHYFSNRFRQYTGQPPTAYCKQYKTDFSDANYGKINK